MPEISMRITIYKVGSRSKFLNLGPRMYVSIDIASSILYESIETGSRKDIREIEDSLKKRAEEALVKKNLDVSELHAVIVMV